ncbi:LysR substrate-binding domain-containing protein [Cupriavidus sp. 30B13]|uniref:LysR substrate-binding domain-containing protein n=1 Tax=Cupriavidus sp. 30B13 TaxID=3384241 RepID=UPI003B909BA1
MAQIPRSQLRVSIPLVSVQFLPALTAFQFAHPEIELDIDCDNRKVKLVEEGYDVVIRTGNVEDDSLASCELGSFPLFVVGSPDYLSRHGRPVRPSDLADHAIVQYRLPHNGQLMHWPLLLAEDEQPPLLVPRVICNSNEARLHFALEGLGLTCMSEFSVRDALQAGTLEAVLEPHTRNRHTFRLVWTENSVARPERLAFAEFVNTMMTDGTLRAPDPP